jgi:hypothetical protein
MALAAVKGEKTLAELAQQYDVRPNLINQRQSTYRTREPVQTNRATSDTRTMRKSDDAVGFMVSRAALRPEERTIGF